MDAILDLAALPPLVLESVRYDLLDEYDTPFDAVERPPAHQLHRELRLGFTGGVELFISWCNNPEVYCVGVGRVPFFQTPTNVRVDVTESPLWSPFVGRTVTLAFLDRWHQVLAIRTDGATLYCCSSNGELYGFDRIYVAPRPPAFPPGMASPLDGLT